MLFSKGPSVFVSAASTAFISAPRSFIPLPYSWTFSRRAAWIFVKLLSMWSMRFCIDRILRSIESFQAFMSPMFCSKALHFSSIMLSAISSTELPP